MNDNANESYVAEVNPGAQRKNEFKEIGEYDNEEQALRAIESWCEETFPGMWEWNNGKRGSQYQQIVHKLGVCGDYCMAYCRQQESEE
jgi:hypothetical protein